jgi:hypothetical protein
MMNIPSLTTNPVDGPTEAQRYYDSVFAKTASRDQAMKATSQRYGPPGQEDQGGLPPVPGQMPADVTAQLNERAPGLSLGQGMANMGRQFAQQASFGLADEAVGLLSSDPNARANWLRKLSEGRSIDPVESGLAMAAGSFVPAKAIGAVIGGATNALVRLTGLSPKVAGWVASIGAGGATGAAAGAANAEPGQRMAHLGRDALLGAGTAGALEIAANIKPILDKFSERLPLRPAARQRLTDMLVLDELAGANQTVAQAQEQAEQLIQLGVKPTVSDALGGEVSKRLLAPGRRSGLPSAADRAVAAEASQANANYVAQAGPDVRARASALQQQIDAMKAPITGRSPIQTIDRGPTKAQLAWRAEQFPDPRRAMEIATKDMGLSIEEAQRTITLAKTLVETRNEVGSALMALSRRDPVGAKALLEDVFAGRRVVGGAMGRILGAVAGPLVRMTEEAQAKTALETLLNQNPTAYLGKLRQLEATQRTVGAVKNATRGAYAGQIPSGVGTFFSRRPEDQ